MERSSITRDFPVAKAVYSLLKDVSSSFCYPGWNKGRIICQKAQLKRAFSNPGQSSEDSEIDNIVSLTNSPFPFSGTRPSLNDLKQHNSSDATGFSFKPNTELMASGVWIWHRFSVPFWGWLLSWISPGQEIKDPTAIPEMYVQVLTNRRD